ncbi:uncharacterized protein LOC100829143 [Brachypodium distachyon]|uniref:Glycosyltransferase 61 catalytic domain-containing protein n=1 Tax=Brachypodium distachyon TaxID=15368 RepID=I1GRL8_BRADI|nr:uncharacterized protein LOC100829143 [Brachypodium distachyon]KQK14874.1 hypothetical protein BRADI_1g19160v3 [Brachypodium distachyon]|eukprot:XP_003559861.1 uncharacterized protein LOC100829143 [Brachypodium distachyon]
MVQQQHRIYILQFDKGEPPEEEQLSCSPKQPAGATGRRIMYYYHDYGSKNGRQASAKSCSRPSRFLGMRGFFGLLLICFLSVSTFLAAPGSSSFFSGEQQRAAAAAMATAGAPCAAVRGNDTLCCDRTSERADMCFARGDVRMHSASSSFLLVSGNKESSPAPGKKEEQEERIRPYTRKWEANVMATIDEVRIRRVHPAHGGPSAPRCDVVHDVPAVLLSTGGFTGNVYHEFNDGLIPMFVTAAHLRRRVVFVILEYHDWWITKYGDVVSRLSAFPPIDFSADRRVHCFPELIAGLRIHGELTVDPARTPDGATSIADFRALLDDAYRGRLLYLDRLAAARKHRRRPRRRSAINSVEIEKRPRLTIVSRTGSRVIENEEAVVSLASEIGFEVRVIRPERSTEMCKIYRELNGSDAMVGVHGAAMTHFLFMRPGKVFIQVVPLGTDWAAGAYYGEPAARLGLRYVGYKIRPDESSLAREYPAGDPVLVDPAAVAKRGWDVTKKVYLDRQNVRLDLARFREELVKAHRYLVSSGAGAA